MPAAPSRRRPLSRRDVLIGLAAAAAILSLNLSYVYRDLGFVHSPEAVLEGDHHLYISMAESPMGEPEDGRARDAPFCWRLLVPWLASQLVRAGMNVTTAFYALSTSSLFVFLLALYLHTRQRGLDEGPALLSLLLAGLLPGGIRWYLYQYPMPDPWCLALLGLAFVAIEARRDAWLIPLGVLALGARESYLLVLPYYFLRRWQERSFGFALRKTLLYNGLALAVFVAIRLSIDSGNTYDPVAIAQDIARFRWRKLWVNQAYFVSIGTFGALLAIVWLLPGRLLRGLSRHPAELSVVVGAYLSLLLANNTDRLLVYALPVIVPAAASQLAEYRDASRTPLVWLGAPLLALQAYFYTQTLYFQKLGASIFQPARLGVVAATFALWASAVAWLRWRRTRGAT